MSVREGVCGSLFCYLLCFLPYKEEGEELVGPNWCCIPSPLRTHPPHTFNLFLHRKQRSKKINEMPYGFNLPSPGLFLRGRWTLIKLLEIK